MRLALIDRFCRHVASSCDKQLHLNDLAGSLEWQYSMTTGVLSFGARFRWQAQLLGTEAHDSQTWLWAWANRASNIPPQLLSAALTLRVLGKLHQTPELIEPELPLDEFNGHGLAMLASGACQANAYFRAPYDGGAAILLIKDSNFPRCTEPPLHRISTIFPQAIATIAIPNHRLAFSGYLAHYGLIGEADDNIVVVNDDAKGVLTATFDAAQRLTRLEVTVGVQNDV